MPKNGKAQFIWALLKLIKKFACEFTYSWQAEIGTLLSDITIIFCPTENRISDHVWSVEETPARMDAMGLYYIVKKGDPPGNNGAASLRGICAKWTQSADKDDTEVIESADGKTVLRRFTPSDCEQIIRDSHTIR
jgi:hypothetical protein